MNALGLRPGAAPLGRAALLLAAAASVAAQRPDVVPVPLEQRALGFDSGPVRPAPGRRDLGRIRVGGANSLRLDLTGTRLGPGSRLELRALADGAVQWFDADGLAAWGGASAVFNGGEIAVALWSGGTAAVDRVVAPRVEVGLPIAPSDPLDSLCGSDDRTSSADRRQGRQYPTGCTAWLANEFTVVTAGHCTALAAQMVHFEVPPSGPDGQLRYPPPQHQYPYDVASLRRLDAGVGADWAVVRTVRNSNTGLYPGQVQGWYVPGPPPNAVGIARIRITGYGTTQAPVDPARNQTQQTHADLLSGISATTLRYTADTTGGNSGAPILDAATDRVVGVHTHGGCSSGGNQGTRLDRNDLALALAAVQSSKVLGRVDPIGSACAGAVGTARLDAFGPPTLLRSTLLRLSGVAPGATAALVFGTDDRAWQGRPLPQALPGAAGCAVFVSLDVTVGGAATIFGTYETALTVPSDPALVGAVAFVQGFAFEAAAAGITPVASGGLRLQVGRDW